MRVPEVLRPDANAVLLRRPLFWSRAVVWIIVGTAIFLILWACFGRIDQVIAATGKLEPRGSVYEIQSPDGGVILETRVREGDQVKSGDILVKLDHKVAQARVAALESVLQTLKRENAVYASAMDPKQTPVDNAEISAEAKSLAEYRARLSAENSFLRAQLAMSSEGIVLEKDYLQQFETSERDRAERTSLAELKRKGAEQELRSVRTQLEEANKLQANSAEILEAYTKLMSASAGSKLEHLSREANLIRDSSRAKALQDEAVALEITIQQALEERQSINTNYVKQASDRLSENQKSKAHIESEIAQRKLDNDQRIAEAEGQLAASRSTLAHTVITAPVDGTVFDLSFNKPGSVLPSGGILMRIVPSGELIAKIDITNRDIGFVREGMEAGVRLDSFPFREFGEIPGTLYFVGSDVLPPDETTPYYRFPAKVSLTRQTIHAGERDIPLQSGMALTVNIHVRTRSIMSIFTDSLLGPIDRMREVR